MSTSYFRVCVLYLTSNNYTEAYLVGVSSVNYKLDGNIDIEQHISEGTHLSNALRFWVKIKHLLQIMDTTLVLFNTNRKKDYCVQDGFTRI